MDALDRAAAHATAYLASVGARPVGVPVDLAALSASFDEPVPQDGVGDVAAVEELVRLADPGLVATAGPRYFGFVTGGATPAALAADWLTSTWDQNVALGVMSPAAAVVESVAGRWICQLLDLPATASVGFVTGAQMANLTCLAAARATQLARTGWDVSRDGLTGAPRLRVLAGEEVHVTVGVAARILGLGQPELVASDDQGRMRADALRDALGGDAGPAIVCAQAGNVNTGAVDPLGAIADICSASGAWLHVDGAFGLWAAAAPARAHLTAGAARADSWATDAHKWLNVPYDSGIAIVAHVEAHRAAMRMSAPYLVADAELRDGSDWAPESSRRARAFAVWAAITALGRSGVADLVERCCVLAERMAGALRPVPGVEVLNDVVLNQVLVRFTPASGGDADGWTDEVIRRVQRDGTCWVGGTRWRGVRAMRISVSNWSTSVADIDRSAAAILAAHAAV